MIPALVGSSCSDTSGPNGAPALTNSIVFVSDRDGSQQIFVMNADGTNQRQLTTIDGDKGWPAISPDGRRIAFSIGTLVDSGASTLYVMNSDGSGMQPLTTAVALNYKPSWSPDGRRIAFTSTRDGTGEIYTMNADGSAQIKRSSSPSYDFDAAWRPSGNTILFSRGHGGDDPYQIFSMTSAGDSVEFVVNGVQPEWSPSGARFLFKDDLGIEISTADATSMFALAPDYVRHFTPTWSPDEAQLAFSRIADSHEEIWTMDANDGNDELQLTSNEQGNNSYPTWTRH